MQARFVIPMFLILAAGQATACSHIVQTQVSFEVGSAELDRSQIVKLSQWLNRSYASFSTYKSMSIETGASGRIPGKAKALAERRAIHTRRALGILLRTDLPAEVHSLAYRFPKSRSGENNDFASIQLYISPEELDKLPKCHPAAASKPEASSRPPQELTRADRSPTSSMTSLPHRP
ncbi:hypothetical protein SAMN05444746_101244 [Variovorax sp. OK212]|nr:hypothetical protein SAMN05518853_101244 [Variovorax sp. OK202]SFB88351.1 hypothetical protein SAMN05444746_101244 [Variovorax sp. OK212]